MSKRYKLVSDDPNEWTEKERYMRTEGIGYPAAELAERYRRDNILNPYRLALFRGENPIPTEEQQELIDDLPPASRAVLDRLRFQRHFYKKTKEQDNESVYDVPSKTRDSFGQDHKIERCAEQKHHLLLILTGSLSLSYVPELISKLYEKCGDDRLVMKIVATKSAIEMCAKMKLVINEIIYEDRDEWSMWQKRGDQVLHVELRKWADSALIAPLDANTMARIAIQMSDNLVTSLISAWDMEKPIFFAPAMSKYMWDNPLTLQHRIVLKSTLNFKEIFPIQVDGHNPDGSMASVDTITSHIEALVKDQFAVRTHF